MNDIEQLKSIVEQQNKRIQALEATLGIMAYSDRYIFQKSLQMLPNTMIGLFGGALTGRPSGANQADPVSSMFGDVTGTDTVNKTKVSANFSAISTFLTQLRTDLITLNLIKGSA